MMRSGRLAARAARMIAGCTWTPSQMSSAVTSSDSRIAAGKSRRLVMHRRHRVEEMRRLARAGANAFVRLPRRRRRNGRATRDDRATRGSRISSRPPSISGATVTIPTSGRAAAISLQDVLAGPLAARLFRCACAGALRAARRPASAAAGIRPGCAPLNSGLRKLLSRCAGSTRAPPGGRVVRAARTPDSICRSGVGAQAIVVGQNAVTP